MRVFHRRYFHAPSACGSILGTIWWYLFRDSKKSMNFCLLMEKSKYVVAVCTYLQKISSLQWLTKMMIMCWNLQKDQNEANLVQMSCVPHFKMSRSTQRLFCTALLYLAFSDCLLNSFADRDAPISHLNCVLVPSPSRFPRDSQYSQPYLL